MINISGGAAFEKISIQAFLCQLQGGARSNGKRACKHVRVRGSYSLILDLSLHLRGCCLWKLLWFEPSLASYRAVHVLVASVLASTSSTTFMAALSSNLLSRSPSSTISARSSLPTYRDKEIDFKIAEKYYCWKQDKSSWKNQYSSSQGGRRRGAVSLCSSPPPNWS